MTKKHIEKIIEKLNIAKHVVVESNKSIRVMVLDRDGDSHEAATNKTANRLSTAIVSASHESWESVYCGDGSIWMRKS
jgi:hypothetical protein